MTFAPTVPRSISHFPQPSLSEAELSRLWEGQTFPKEALRTREGRLLQVIYRGRRTGGPGPDFRDAVIASREELLQGDVELHVRSSDFRRHGHQRDPAYDRVVLHFVFRHDGEGDTELASGGHAEVVALEDWLEGRAVQIQDWLAQPPLWREPCQSAVARLGAPSTGAALDRLGDMRFRQKAAAALRALTTAGGAGVGDGEAVDGLIWSRALEALGYGGQRELMTAVAEGAGWPRLRSTLAGLPPRRRRARALPFLLDALAHAQLRVPLVLRPMRAGNRPEARLAGAAALASRFADGILVLVAPLIQAAAAGRSARLISAFTVEKCIGRDRAIEILSNAVLPVASAAGVEGAEAAYRALPMPARYGAVKHIHSALAGALRIGARRQQGMLYLLNDYCTRGGCGRCPLS